MGGTSGVIVGVGGSAGDGIASTGETFAKICARHGLHVYAYNSYQSVIRGGHVYMQIRSAPEKIWTHGNHPQLIIALNQDTVNRHARDIAPGGGILFNSDKITVQPDQLPKDVQAYGLPVLQLAKSPLQQNVVALGALMYLLDTKIEVLTELLAQTFARKGEVVIAQNTQAAQAGYAYAQAHFGAPNRPLHLDRGTKRRMLLTGNQVFAVGSLVAGCKFYSAYPMTPASSILHTLAKYAANNGMVLKQAEDEIAAINMAIGAGHVGVRAMTGTAGGGFALMTEAVGMAGMTETPVVVIEVQRGGPSTGLPTKTEQGDLFQVFGASQGDFPKVILAPRTIEECYPLIGEAFNLAEKYQCPVLIISDLLLSEHQETVESLPASLPIDRGAVVNGAVSETEGYKRFAITPSGISPRALPGHPGTLYTTASDEHDEDGIVISDVFSDTAKRFHMMNKRMRKMDGILQELPPPKIEGPARADLTLVGWGSTYNVLREAMESINATGGRQVNLLTIRNLWPFQTEAVTKLLTAAKQTLIVEVNYSGQLARFIRMETGIAMQHRLAKYDGEPFTTDQVLDTAHAILAGKETRPVIAVYDESPQAAAHV